MATDVAPAYNPQLMARVCTNQWATDARFTPEIAASIIRTLTTQLKRGVSNGEIDAAETVEVFQIVNRNPSMLSSIMAFSRHWYGEVSRAPVGDAQSDEILQTLSYGFCIASALSDVQKNIDTYIVAVQNGGSAIERAEPCTENVIVVTQAIVMILSRNQYRRRNGLLYHQYKYEGIETRAWVPVTNPRTREQYTIEDFVQYQTSMDVNPDLHELLRGHVTRGDVVHVVDGLLLSEHRMFPFVQPYEHAFSFIDGIYIGFLPRIGPFAAAEYDDLWKAVEQGSVHCIRNVRGRELTSALCVDRMDGEFVADLFLSHDDAARLLPESLVTCRFFPHAARGAMQMDTVGARDWERITTRIYDYVLACQWGDPGVSADDRRRRERDVLERSGYTDLNKHGRDAARTMSICLGRMLFPANRFQPNDNSLHRLQCKLDPFDIVPIFIGRGGTGKSSLADVVTSFVPIEDVGSIANRGEQIFAFMSVHNKRMATGMEIKKDLNMDTAFLQQMAAGERCTIAVKNQPAISKCWSTSLCFGCNELPDVWQDAQGALTRRFITFKFDEEPPPETVAPVKVGGELSVQIHRTDEAAALLRKMYLAYLTFADEHGHSAMIYRKPPGVGLNFADVPAEEFDACPMPKVMHMWSRATSKEMNALREYVASTANFVHLDRAEFDEAMLAEGFDTVEHCLDSAYQTVTCMRVVDILNYLKRDNVKATPSSFKNAIRQGSEGSMYVESNLTDDGRLPLGQWHYMENNPDKESPVTVPCRSQHRAGEWIRGTRVHRQLLSDAFDRMHTKPPVSDNTGKLAVYVAYRMMEQASVATEANSRGPEPQSDAQSATAGGPARSKRPRIDDPNTKTDGGAGIEDMR